MPGLSFYDKQHIQKVAAQQGVINNIFNQFILSVSPYLRKWSDTGKNNVWIQNNSVENAVDKELLTLQSLLLKNIESFQFDAWKRSGMKNDNFIREYIKGMAISSAVKEGMFTHNMSAFSAFQKDVDAQGLRLSDRVWNIAQQTKSQLEFYLNSGIATGRSSNEISRDMRQLLDKPDKRFRRVRNDEGKLVLSRPMKDYHPGQGVYRSAKMNALRTSATTTNAAYRTADYERWSNQDFVLGIEIQRSANNRGPCKICDAMVGRYPKTFKFTGFHPFCICFATPITMEPDDFADFLVDDTIPQKQVITDIPQSAKDFVSENKDGLQSAFWYKDNFTKEGKLQRNIQPQKPVVTTPINSFTKCNSFDEAVARAKSYGIDKFDMGDATLEEVNVILEAIFEESQAAKIELSEFKLVRNLGQQLGTKKAVGGVYHYQNNSIQIDLADFKTNVFKEVESYEERVSKLQKNIEGLKKQIEQNEARLGKSKAIDKMLKSDIKMLNSRISDIEVKIHKFEVAIARGEQPLPFTVDTTLKTINEQVKCEIHHEFGHYVDHKLGRPSFTNNKYISEYGSGERNENFAEWYAHYRVKGKEGVPEDLLSIFEKYDSNNTPYDSLSVKKQIIRKVKTDAEKADIQNRWNDRKLYNKIANTENEIRMNKKFETGVVFDKNGNVLIDKRGAKYSVRFTNEECAKMKDCVFTHNHPRGWNHPEKSLGRIGNSFSPEDIFLAIAHDVSEMRAVTPNYTFVMKRPEAGWGIDIKKFEKLLNQENNNLRREFMARVNNNTLSPAMAEAVHYHTLWKRVSEKMGWSYSKAKTR